MKTLFI